MKGQDCHTHTFHSAGVDRLDDAVGEDLLLRANHDGVGVRIIVFHPVDLEAVVTLEYTEGQKEQ